MSTTAQANGFPSPQLGSGYMDSAFVIVGTLGAVIWDMISNLNFDYGLVRKSLGGEEVTEEDPIKNDRPKVTREDPTKNDRPRIRWTVLVYFVSRIATFAAFTLASVSDTRPINDCSGFLSVVSWTFAVSISATSLLFFFRVRAFYYYWNQYVVGFFFLLWLGVVAGSIAGALARVLTVKDRVVFANDPFCIEDPFDLVIVVITINVLPMANNALGFIAVMWHLRKFTHGASTFKNGLEVMVFGHHLPKLHKALLKDSQISFLTIVTVHIGSVAIFYSRGGFQPINFALFLPNVAVMNLMGSRIYRNTQRGMRSLSEVQTASSPSRPIAFQDNDGEIGDATVT